MTKRRVCVVVIGDVGHSPRMQMHSLSLAKCNFDVDLIGFLSSQPDHELTKHRNISLWGLSEAPDFSRVMPRIVAWGLRILWQTLSLFFCMVLRQAPDVIMVQNPPSVPSLAVCWLLSRIRGSELLIDWHNYGYTILRLQYSGGTSVAVKCYKYLEFAFGRLADKHFCVSKAFQRDLHKELGIRAKVLYDRPSEKFNQITTKVKHDLFSKLSNDYPAFTSESGTRFTEYVTGEPVMKSDRPALVVSSTSWTEDEDFSILLKALELYDRRSGPSVVCVITGKGPLKEYYKQYIGKCVFRKVDFVLPWLDADDYPKLLAASDVGVCLHTSSSGLDLPMKVVDMFGCGLPVCAFDYDCIGELVTAGSNGLLFKSSIELSNQLSDLLSNFPRESSELNRFRDNIIKSFQTNRWHNYWCRTALSAFE